MHYSAVTPREQTERIETLEIEIKKLKLELLQARRDDLQYMLRRTINDSMIKLQRLYEAV